jgi:PD-(D/E)XK nuclease superfamily
MRLRSLSASSAQVYEECPARWAAEMRDRVPQIGGSAANLGTACHGTFDDFVKNNWHLRPMGEQLQAIVQLYDHWYHVLFSDTERYEEALHSQDQRR